MNKDVYAHLDALTRLAGEIEEVTRDDREELASTILEHVERLREAIGSPPPAPEPRTVSVADERLAAATQAVRAEAAMIEAVVNDAQAKLLALAVLRAIAAVD